MANLNKVMLIGRLTREPEAQTFSNGGKVAKFGFAVNNRKKNNQTGEWEEVPVFVDCEAFNRETGRKLADTVLQYLHKGDPAFIEGHLHLDQWVDKNDGSKRSKLKIVVDSLEFLGGKQEGANQEGAPPRASRGAPAGPSRGPAGNAPARGGFSSYNEPPEPQEPPPDAMGDPDNIPF